MYCMSFLLRLLSTLRRTGLCEIDSTLERLHEIKQHHVEAERLPAEEDRAVGPARRRTRGSVAELFVEGSRGRVLDIHVEGDRPVTAAPDKLLRGGRELRGDTAAAAALGDAD